MRRVQLSGMGSRVKTLRATVWLGVGLLVETLLPAGAAVQPWLWRKWWPQEAQGWVETWRGLGMGGGRLWCGLGFAGHRDWAAEALPEGVVAAPDYGVAAVWVDDLGRVRDTTGLDHSE